MKGKVKILILVLVFILSIPMTCVATNSIGMEFGLTAPTELFMETCDDFFADPGYYRAIDKTGTDVTDSFYSDYVSAYINGQYKDIWDAFLDKLSVITWTNDEPQPIGLMNYTASDSFYVLDKTTEHMPGKTFEMLYTISGKYRVNDSTLTISDTDNAILNIDAFNAGALFSYTLKDVSTNTRIASNLKSVTFSASFKLDLRFYKTIIIQWTEEFGPYSNSVVGLANR